MKRLWANKAVSIRARLRDSTGQATLELALSALLVVIIVSGSGWVLKAQWRRTQCAALVFRETHSRLQGVIRIFPQTGLRITIAEDSEGFTGTAECGEGIREQVRLKKLEAIQW